MKISSLLSSFAITLLLLLILDVFVTSFLPALGIQKYRPAFQVIIILFMGLRLGHPSLPILILIVNFFHSAFTIEGWAQGTFAGVLVSIVISLLKDVLHLSSAPVTVVIVQILQVAWFLIESFLIFFRMGEMNYFFSRLEYFIPESIILSLLSPFFFKLLEKIWKGEEESIGVNI